jgi:CRP-like cAMP-binding protein
MEELLTLLKAHSFSQSLHPDHLAKLARCGRVTRVYTDNYVFREKQDADRFYLVQKGSVMLETEHAGSTASIQTLEAGKLLGCSWLFEPYRWRFDARALTPIELLDFDAQAVRRLLQEDHELGYQFLVRVIQATSERLDATRFQMLDLYEKKR